ncbi:DUF3311 domain-containing protein [Streptomyces anulatus]|nr:DUF3311 domain-containing protein [Streptomyces anulatus]WIY81080.1 DUF3311 domain-containing protein [Streptomyces anulatus]
MIRRRPQLLWLLVPYVLYLGVLPFANRVTPLVFGMPFLFVWLLGATLLTPVAVWLTGRGDRRERRRHLVSPSRRSRDTAQHGRGRA